MNVRHIAIIMDGNGRWAQKHGHLRTWGHREGAKRVDDIVTECCRLGIPYLTLYAFSTENWNRPQSEVNLLMRLLISQLRSMDKKLVKNRVSLHAKGSVDRLPESVQKELKRVMDLTAVPEPACRLTLCLSYGGREEITRAARRLAEKVKRGEINPDQIDEKVFQDHLDQPEFPDPDLLIRTGGDYRVSNFLLWEIAYSEFFITPKLWPEFGPEALKDALDSFGVRERRYGKTSAQVSQPENPLGVQ